MCFFEANILPSIARGITEPLLYFSYDLLFASASVHYDVEEEPLFLFVVAFICEALLMVWGLYLVRKEKHSEIEALWSEKWQIPAEPSVTE